MGVSDKATIARLQAKIRALQKQLDNRKNELSKPTAGPTGRGRIGAVLAFASGRFDEALRIAAQRADKGLHAKMKAFVTAFRAGLAAYDRRDFEKALAQFNEALFLAKPLGGLALKHIHKIRKLLAVCFFYRGLLAMSGLQYSAAFVYFSAAKRYSPDMQGLHKKFNELEAIAQRKMKMALQNPGSRTNDGRSFCRLHLQNAARLVPKGSPLFEQLRKAAGNCK